MNSKVALWIIYLLFASLPSLFTFILMFFFGGSFNRTVNPTFISGFITANGVFLGFLAALLLSQKIVLDLTLERVIVIDLLLFGISLFTVIGNATVSETANLASLLAVTTSLSANLGSVVIIFDSTKKTNN